MSEIAHVERVGRALLVADTLTQEAEQRRLLGLYVEQQMVEGTDYGVIPGTEKRDKAGRDISTKALYKPGAEKLTALFRCVPQFELLKEIADWETGLFYYRFKCRIVTLADGVTVAEGVGSCSSYESRYRWRKGERLCPECDKPCIIKGKAEYGGGWLCLSPDTPILYSDFVWRPIGEAKVGDKIMGFDESPAGKHHPRRFMPSTIEAVWSSKQQTKRLITNKADILTTASHRWLRHLPSNGPHWMPTSRLEVGRGLRNIGLHDSPKVTDEYRMGYLSGMTEGDGTMRYTPGQTSSSDPSVPYWRVAISSRDEVILGRLAAYLAHFGVGSNIRPHDGGPLSRSMQTAPLVKIETRALGNLSVIHNLIQPRQGAEFARGFLAGFFDAEGTGEGKHMRVYQNDVSTLEAFSRMAAGLGFRFDVKPVDGQCSNARFMGTTLDRIRFFNCVQPALLRKAGVEGIVMHHEADKILAIEDGPMADLVDIQTSTGTFFAAGIATHNCFGKKGGCGAKFPDGDQSIESQTTDRVQNPDLADMDNTVLKMAKKRAHVDAAISLARCSDMFTQDVEDVADNHEPKPQPAQRQASRPQPIDGDPELCDSIIFSLSQVKTDTEFQKVLQEARREWPRFSKDNQNRFLAAKEIVTARLEGEKSASPTSAAAAARPATSVNAPGTDRNVIFPAMARVATATGQPFDELMQALADEFGVGSLDDMPPEQVGHVVEWLEARMPKGEIFEKGKELSRKH